MKRKLRWLEVSFSTEILRNAVVGCCGLWLLASGLGQWTRAVVGKDFAEGRSPLLYGTSVKLHQAPSATTGQWTVVVRADVPAAVCAQLRKDAAEHGQLNGIDAVIVPTSGVEAFRCSLGTQAVVGERATGSEGSLVAAQRPDPVPPSGFVIIGDGGRVVYGSSKTADLSHVGSILELFIVT